MVFNSIVTVSGLLLNEKLNSSSGVKVRTTPKCIYHSVELLNVMSAILGLTTMLTNAFHNLIGQIGPAYDPLFYDVMVYIFGTMLFAVFLLSVIAFYLRKKGIGGGSAKEKWVSELDKYFDREQIGLIPDELHHW